MTNKVKIEIEIDKDTDNATLTIFTPETESPLTIKLEGVTCQISTGRLPNALRSEVPGERNVSFELRGEPVGE